MDDLEQRILQVRQEARSTAFEGFRQVRAVLPPGSPAIKTLDSLDVYTALLLEDLLGSLTARLEEAKMLADIFGVKLQDEGGSA